jgi:hypothetical protein
VTAGWARGTDELEDMNPRIDDMLRSILTRLVAYVAVVIAAGLIFLAKATVYQLSWPKPVIPFSQMSDSP